MNSALQATEASTLTTDETASVDEDAAFDARELGQLVITNTAPLLWKCLAALKAFGRDGDGLNAPVAACFIRIEDVKRFLSIWNLKRLFEFKEMFLGREINYQK